MKNSINLLDYKNKVQPKHENNKQKPLRIAAVSLLFIVSASAIVFFILVVLSPIPQLREQEKTASFKLTDSHKDIVKLGLVKERTGNIQEIIDKRPYYDRTLNSLQAELPSGILADAVDIDKDNFSVTFSSNSLKNLDNFLNALTKKAELEKEFSQINIVDLTTDKDNSGNFLLIVRVKKV